MMSCYDKWNNKHSIGIGESLLTSLFTFSLISTQIKTPRSLVVAIYIWTKFNVERADWKQFVQFSALCKQCWRKYQPSKTAKLLGGKKLMSHTFFVKFQVFKRNFSETIWYIGLRFSEISVMLFQFSEILFYKLHQMMMSIC